MVSGRIRPRFKQSRYGEEEDGTLPRFTFEYPESFAVVRDTREQGGLFRKPIEGLIVIRKALPIEGLKNRWADYSIGGFETAVIAEMKEIDDLWTSLTVNSDDFWEKLEYMAKYERAYLIINGTYAETISWRTHREIHPNVIRQKLASLEGRLGIRTHFGESIEDIERWFLSWAIRFYKMKRGL